MTKLSQVDELDFILSFLKDRKASVTVEDVRIHCAAQGVDIDIEQIRTILRHLIDEEYVIDRKTGTYKLSIKGISFIGFQKNEILQNEELAKISRRERDDARYRDRLLWATWSAGIFAGDRQPQ